MKTFTLQQISEIINYQHLVARDRFFYYFEHLYGYDKQRIGRYWDAFNRFPGVVSNPDHHELLDDLLGKVTEIVGIIGLNEAIPYRVRMHSAPVRKMIHYQAEGQDEVAVVEVDFSKAAEVIVYADILRRGCSIVAAPDFAERISAGRLGYMDVYDGDIFATYEDGIWCRGQEGNIYVCDKGTYRRLLYTAGKGYLRKGEPDYDMDHAYNSHVVTGNRNFTKIGNIYVDCSMLEDKQPEE